MRSNRASIIPGCGRLACLLVVILSASCLSALPSTAQTAGYQVVDLGPFIPRSINDSGQMAGSVLATFSTEHAFLYDQGRLQDLGTLGGSRSFAWSMNRIGGVVGVAATSGGQQRAFLYRDRLMRDLGTLGGPTSIAYDINDAGQVVGVAQTAAGEYHAFIWTDANGNGTRDPGEMVDLGTAGLSSEAHAIDPTGRVTGYRDTGASDDAGGPIRHAFLYSGGVMYDLGTLGVATYPRDMNSSGAITGIWQRISPTTTVRAFLYQGGGLQDLGDPASPPPGRYSAAAAINEAGVVVGGFDTDDYRTHAFLYSGGAFTDLNSQVAGSGWELRGASCINNLGAIGGAGYLNGRYGGFLLQDAQPAASLQSLTVSPAAVTGGAAGPEAATGTVTLSSPAPAGGVSVTLRAETIWPLTNVPAPLVAEVPGTVTVLPGETSVTFPITTQPVQYSLTVRITARSGASTRRADLQVNPTTIGSLGPEADARVQAILDQFLVLGDYDAALDAIITLRNSSTALGQDIYLAAADHYLFALTWVLEHPTHVVLVAGFVLVYEIIKLAADLSTTERKASPATRLSVVWGERGVVDAVRILFGASAVRGSFPGGRPPIR